MAIDNLKKQLILTLFNFQYTFLAIYIYSQKKWLPKKEATAPPSNTSSN